MPSRAFEVRRGLARSLPLFLGVAAGVLVSAKAALPTGCHRGVGDSAAAPESEPRPTAAAQAAGLASSPSQVDAGRCDALAVTKSADVAGSQFTARVLAATAIEVAVDVQAAARLPLAVCAERWMKGGWTEPQCSEEGLSYKGQRGAVVLEATPKSKEKVRAAVDPGSGSRDAWVWSSPIEVEMPAPPIGLPTAPAGIATRPISPYAAEIAWSVTEDCTNAPYGFEVLRSTAGSESRASVPPAFPGRVAILPVWTPRVTIRGLMPGGAYTFSVRAFNPKGASPASEAPTVRLPSGTSATPAAQHMAAYAYGVRRTVVVHGRVSDVDYYVVCPGGTWAVARDEADGHLSALSPPFGEVCQAWPTIEDLEVRGHGPRR